MPSARAAAGSASLQSHKRDQALHITIARSKPARRLAIRLHRALHALLRRVDQLFANMDDGGRSAMGFRDIASVASLPALFHVPLRSALLLSSIVFAADQLTEAEQKLRSNDEIRKIKINGKTSLTIYQISRKEKKMNDQNVDEVRTREEEILRTLQRAGVHVQSLADVDPYNAALAAKFALDDLDGLLELNDRLIAKFDTCREKNELQEIMDEMRAVNICQRLTRKSISKCRFSYSKN